METQVLLEKLTAAIAFKFRDDATVPGVTVACLRSGEFYCSIVRYSPIYENHKLVVCKSTGVNLHEAVLNTAKAFLRLAAPPPNPVQELDGLVGKIA